MIKNKIIVASSKGGVGKSTVSCGIARALVEQGNKVLLVDCDFGNRCLDLLLSKEDEVIYNLYDIVSNRTNYKNATLPIEKYPGLFLIPAPSNKPDINLEKVSDCLNNIANDEDYDFIICDTSSGVAVSSALAKNFADTALIIATQQPTSIRAAENLATIFDETKIKYTRMIISAFDVRTASKSERYGILDIINRSKVQTIGVVPYDEKIIISSDNGEFCSKKSIPYFAFDNISKRIEGNNIPLFYGIKKINRKKVL